MSRDITRDMMQDPYHPAWDKWFEDHAEQVFEEAQTQEVLEGIAESTQVTFDSDTKAERKRKAKALKRACDIVRSVMSVSDPHEIDTLDCTIGVLNTIIESM